MQQATRTAGHGSARILAAALPAVLAAAVLVAACTRSVPGTPVAAPDRPPLASTEPYSADETGPRPRAGLDADALPDECLLDADQFGTLVGRPVREPEQLGVRRADGSIGNACYASARDGPPTPLAAVNVYTVRSGTPADFVRAAPPGGRKYLVGLGEAAAVVDTATGPTLQVASPRFLVTVVALENMPTDDAWRAAGEAALARLPR